MKTKNDYLLTALNILSWIIFVGLCIEAGGIISNAVYAYFFNPSAANLFWGKFNFSNLYQFDSSQFIVLITLMSIVAVLKALLFYLIIKVFYEKKLNLYQPFNNDLQRLISNMSYSCLGIGSFSYWGVNFTNWLNTKNIIVPKIEQLGFGGADVWLFMFIILFVIAKIFKKGMELQLENDLTI